MQPLRPWPASSRPYTRWWWFNQHLDLKKIQGQLDWLKENGFGGVEIAWVYPVAGRSESGPEWLGPDWSEIVAATKQECDARGLGCDFTFGSLWPFCGSFLTEPDTAHDFKGPMSEGVPNTWEIDDVPMLNHLSRKSLAVYADHLMPAFREALKGRTSALFCDSWEVPTRRLWSPQLWEVFEDQFHYDLRMLLDSEPAELPAVRYDYYKFLARVIVDEFYAPFAAACREAGAVSRVQCHGSPTDLLEAYGVVDVPESEALLFEPTFSRIAASAALLSRKPVVSCETFTCLYGFPGRLMKRERIGDLKLLADSVFAQGVNQIVWHGLAYYDPANPDGGQPFFATTHLGPTCGFAADLPAFNRYLTTVSDHMSRGRTLSSLAVYLPVEDGRMRGRIPSHERTPAAHSYWELRDAVPPEETRGHHPIWVSEPALRSGEVRGGRLYVGDAEFSALYVDVEWMDLESLRALTRVARLGLPILLKRLPKQPGYIPSHEYSLSLIPALTALPNVTDRPEKVLPPPFLEGDALPPYWARLDGDKIRLFLAHPGASEVRYPMRSGWGESLPPEKRRLTLRYGPIKHEIKAEFGPNESLLFEVDKRGVRRIELDPQSSPPAERSFGNRLRAALRLGPRGEN